MAEPLPRVTHILQAVGLGPDLSMVPPDVLARAQERGTAVHKLIEAAVYGYLDEADVTLDIAGYLDAFRKFVAESGAQHIVSEFEVRHDVWNYVGHPDGLYWLLKQRVIIDFKTGVSDGVEYQLVAYIDAWNSEHPTEQVTAGASVDLRDDGSYRFNEIDLNAARPVWYAAVTVFHAQKRRAA